jgi:uncharacterized membrane protein
MSNLKHRGYSNCVLTLWLYQTESFPFRLLFVFFSTVITVIYRVKSIYMRILEPLDLQTICEKLIQFCTVPLHESRNATV